MSFSFIDALYGRPHDGVPVWFMRQAGRYLPGYQSVRAKTDFLTLCKTPDLAAEVTVEPLDTFGVDAVIIFSDILVPLEAMGIPVVFTDRGPCMEKPVRSAADIDALRDMDPVRETGFVMDVIRAVKERVAGRVPVIGFAGAPWTLACYALEGSPSRTFASAFRMLYGEPRSMHRLLDKIAKTTAAYLAAQVEAGVDAIQLFDTWGGQLTLAHDQLAPVSLEYCSRVLRELDGCGVPRILFVKGAGHRIEDVARCGAEALGVDQTQSIANIRQRVGSGVALQGNLAPEALLSDTSTLIERADGILESMRGDSAYVFNLGHGILPPTPVDNVRALVEHVKAFGRA
ncbi:MAG: uroporphyrinogen decarboxylase [Planctomycetes bacterium]|nr:uroporphyrinogen decarboxylase [Planctomycetota bacterium]